MCIRDSLKGDHFINCIDRTLERIYGKAEFIPELIISFGGAIISKKIKTLFRNYNPFEHWSISDNNNSMDVFTSLTRIIPVSEELFFEALLKKISISSSGNYKKIWLDEYAISEKNHEKFLQNAPWSDLKACLLYTSPSPRD